MPLEMGLLRISPNYMNGLAGGQERGGEASRRAAFRERRDCARQQLRISQFGLSRARRRWHRQSLSAPAPATRPACTAARCNHASDEPARASAYNRTEPSSFGACSRLCRASSSTREYATRRACAPRPLSNRIKRLFNPAERGRLVYLQRLCVPPVSAPANASCRILSEKLVHAEA